MRKYTITLKQPTAENGLQHNERSTPLWSLNCLRSDLLPHLLDDLFEAEHSGLHDDHCKAVKHALSKVVHAATTIPKGAFWSRAIWAEIQELEELYHHWNSAGTRTDDAAQKHRKETLRKLRRQRNKIATKIRKNQHILANDLDLQLLDASHQAMADLVTAVPDLFKELGKAVGRYAKRANL